MHLSAGWLELSMWGPRRYRQNIKGMAKTFRLAKSGFGMLKKKEFTYEMRNTKRPWRSWKTTKVVAELLLGERKSSSQHGHKSSTSLNNKVLTAGNVQEHYSYIPQCQSQSENINAIEQLLSCWRQNWRQKGPQTSSIWSLTKGGRKRKNCGDLGSRL